MLSRRRKRRGRGNGKDRKCTRLNSSHMSLSYAVFCFKKTAPSCCCFDDPATTEICTLPLHDALPIYQCPDDIPQCCREGENGGEGAMANLTKITCTVRAAYGRGALAGSCPRTPLGQQGQGQLVQGLPLDRGDTVSPH